MNTKDAIKWAGYYRLLASGSFVVGIAIAFFGVSAGLGEAVQILFTELGNSGAVDEAQAAANVPLAVISLIAGVFVWQIGKSAAFFWTLNGAIDAETSAVDEGPPPEPAPEPDPRRDPADQRGPGIGASETAGQADGSAATENPDERTPPTAGTGTRTGSPAARGENETARTGTAPGDNQIDHKSDTTSDGVSGAAEASTADADGPVGASTADADGTAAVAADDDASAAFENTGGDDTDEVTCDDCGHANKESVSFCMNCGAEL
jgi:hypothetical protein